MRAISAAIRRPCLCRAALALCTVSLSLLAANAAVAAACNTTPQGEGRVSEIIDARTLRLDDGREVRLAGIEPVAVAADRVQGTSALAALAFGHEVMLYGPDDAPDRYGRQSAFVFVDRDEMSIQETLLSRGQALFSGTFAVRGCSTDLAAAETTARRAGRGIWSGSAVIKNAESPGDILTRVGRFTVVEGKVLSVRQAGATTYVNFGRRWTQDFAVTISRQTQAAFEAAGVPPNFFQNKRIRVRGWVEKRNGPRIEVLQMGQIEVVGGT
jgi:endonuclease YncB( thermonuclease family)